MIFNVVFLQGAMGAGLVLAFMFICALAAIPVLAAILYARSINKKPDAPKGITFLSSLGMALAIIALGVIGVILLGSILFGNVAID